MNRPSVLPATRLAPAPAGPPTIEEMRAAVSLDLTSDHIAALGTAYRAIASNPARSAEAQRVREVWARLRWERAVAHLHTPGGA